MFMMKTKEHYKVAHITNEIGNYMIGGIATVINELYSKREENTCFIHLYDDSYNNRIATANYPGDSDIYTVSMDRLEEISQINFDIAVLHYYGLEDAVSEEILGNRELVYVVHSVNTPEPYERNNPFGIHTGIEASFRRLCSRAIKIICVSQAEKEKLLSIFGDLEGKVEVIYNGITFDQEEFVRDIPDQRTKFGYIGRLDYRKGILETVKALDSKKKAQYYLACGKGDYNYLREIMLYAQGAKMENRMHFLGYCTGERKVKFFQFIDCLIISSLYEPFGMILLEAFQYDVPVICSNNGGLAELLGDYKYQYNPYLEGDLEQVLTQFEQASPAEIHTECCKLKAHLKAFTKEEMTNRYNQLFADIL